MPASAMVGQTVMGRTNFLIRLEAHLTGGGGGGRGIYSHLVLGTWIPILRGGNGGSSRGPAVTALLNDVLAKGLPRICVSNHRLIPQSTSI